MSTTFGDPHIAKELAHSVDEGPCDIGELSHGLIVGLAYLFQVVLIGGWCEFDDTNEHNTYFGMRKYIDQLSCRPLLAPWLEMKPWTQEQVDALKIAHRLQN